MQVFLFISSLVIQTGCAMSFQVLTYFLLKSGDLLANFFQTPKLTQTVSLILKNLSNTFVYELVVLASVNFGYDTIWKICYFTQTP